VKRGPALVSLSRDHHLALFVAQGLCRATLKTAAEAHAALLAYWQEYGQAHFCSEEELLLPAYAQHADPQDPLVARVLSDHAAISQRIADMDCDSTPTIEALHELGCLMAAHVRLEERKLFPLIENALPPAQLAVLAAVLDRADNDP
jgi:hypothetical protein